MNTLLTKTFIGALVLYVALMVGLIFCVNFLIGRCVESDVGRAVNNVIVEWVDEHKDRHQENKEEE